MKTKITFFRSAFAAVLLVVASTQSYATFSYTISFTASGSTASVGSVEVKNLTKGTMATVANGNTLTLTDQTTAVDALNANDGGIRIVSLPLPPSFGIKLTPLSLSEKSKDDKQVKNEVP